VPKSATVPARSSHAARISAAPAARAAMSSPSVSSWRTMRPRAAPSESLTDIATFAAKRTLADAGVDPLDVDLILVATMSPDELIPNAAPVVAHELGAERAGAMDIGAAC
jgi:3-oxoacyl-[acyl-carrier-protein] synthase III